jgi:hypothetical protein
MVIKFTNFHRRIISNCTYSLRLHICVAQYDRPPGVVLLGGVVVGAGVVDVVSRKSVDVEAGVEVTSS